MPLNRRCESLAFLLFTAFVLLVMAPPAHAQLTAIKAPLTNTYPQDGTVPPKRQFLYCHGSYGTPPNTKPIPLEWEIELRNDGLTQLTGVTFTDDVRAGDNGTNFSLLCPATLVPSGAVVTCNTATNTITVSNITVPPCGRVHLRFATEVDPNAPILTNLCNGGVVTQGANSFRTKSPFGANQEYIPATNPDDTCVLKSGICPAFKPYNLRVYHTLTDVNGPPMLPGDKIIVKARFDTRYAPTPSFDFDHYDENQDGVGPIALPLFIDPDPSPFISKPIVGALYVWNPALRQISVIDDPAIPGLPPLATGTIIDLVEWSGVVNCAVPAGAAQCTQSGLYLTGGTFLGVDDPTTYDVTDGSCAIPVQPTFSTSGKSIADGDSSGNAQPNEILTFKVTVQNSTPAPSRFMNCETQATAVEVVDTVDLTFLDPTSIVVNNGGTRSGNRITWTLPTLNADGRTGNPTDLTFTAKVLSTVNTGDRICNTSATITSAELKSVADGGKSGCATELPFVVPRACIDVLVPATPQLSITKSAPQPTYCAGDTFLYTVTVSNGGGAPANNVDVTDILDNFWLPANITPLNGGILCPRPTCTPATVTWPQIPALASTSSQSFQIRVTIPPTTASGTNITNVARAKASNAAAPPDATFPITVLGPTLTFDKVLNTVPPVSEGQALDWTITLKNTGGCPATNVVVSDTIDTSFLDDTTLTFTPPGGVYNMLTKVLAWPATTVNANQTLSYTVHAEIYKPG